MDKEKQKKILILALYAGELLMKNGAEVSRVQDTVTRIVKACGIQYVESFAVPTGIFISIDNGDSDDDTYTFLKQIKSTTTNLNKIAKLNSFSREFVSTDMTIDEGMAILKAIEDEKPYPFPFRLIGAGVGAGAFSLLIGANILEALAAFVIGMISFCLAVLMNSYNANFFIKNVCCSALSGLLAMALSVASPLAPLVTYKPIVVGVLMLFVPGVAITNCIRDLLDGQLISGESRISEVILTAVSLAAGAGIVIKLWTMLGGIF